LQHNGISWSFSVLHPSSQHICHLPFKSRPRSGSMPCDSET